ncbi:MAG: hypothetical protein GY720_00140 [bacterium]|nr:hypothetical protein [bacterium]
MAHADAAMIAVHSVDSADSRFGGDFTEAPRASLERELENRLGCFVVSDERLPGRHPQHEVARDHLIDQELEVAVRRDDTFIRAGQRPNLDGAQIPEAVLDDPDQLVEWATTARNVARAAKKK